MSVSLVILAAGQGSRMQSDLPKVLHPLGAVPLVLHALRAGQMLMPERVVVVVGHGGDAVAKTVAAENPDAVVVQQAAQLGTAHAVDQARAALGGCGAGDVVVLYGDTPFIRAETLERMLAARASHDIVVLGFDAADPGRYGRLVTEGDRLERIVEFKDASEAERAITLCNSGVVCASRATLFELIAEWAIPMRRANIT
jgi:bifunctional UDP-N-acetylglucosamine pyrophosphorylase / glucosamine-1-phosphate N-acetyltransferase